MRGGLHPSRVAWATTQSAQKTALMDLYTATLGGSWTNSAGWSTSGSSTPDPCDNAWFGVTCNGNSGTNNRNV